jgi:cyanophycin synthetase
MISILGHHKEIDPKDFFDYGGQYLILKEAQKKGVDCRILIQKQVGKKTIYIRLKKGNQSHWISHQRGFFNSRPSCDLALSKYLTYQILESARLPTPQFTKINQLKQIEQIKIPRPWVAKPINQTKGRDVVIKIKNRQELRKTIRRLFKKYHSLMIEQFIRGKDYRLLILDNKLLGAVRRIPARIKGDGTHNIRQLIEISNKKERRTKAKELNPFKKKIKIDLEIKRCLAQKNLKLSSILKKDQVIQIRKNANFSTGGEAEDITDQVHPDNIKIARKAIKALGLKLGGVDIISKDISQPLTQNGGKIIEVNGNPSLWIHHFPNYGPGRNATGQIIDYLFRN